MAKYPLAVIPFSGLSPAACEALAAAIDDAVEALRKWQLPTGPNTRLLNAKRRLLKVSAQGSYGATPPELYETAKAILVANDFYGISRTMQDERAAPIAKELKLALRGPLSESATKNNTAFDIQSQFWFGTVLAYSGLHPAVPDTKKTKPDFVITVDTLECGVEIKRPKSASSASAALSSAASQLREYGKPGVIVLDLAQCIGADQLILHEGPPSARELVRHRFFPLVTQLADEMTHYSHSDKFQRILVLQTYARFFNWTLGREKDVDMGFFFKSIPFPDACHGLVGDQSKHIQTRIARGFERLSGNPLSIRRTRK
jgi:hypothetical protein